MKMSGKNGAFVCEVYNLANGMEVEEFQNLLKSLRHLRKKNYAKALQAEATLTARGVEYEPSFGWINLQMPSVKEVKVAMKKIAKGKNLLRLVPAEE